MGGHDQAMSLTSTTVSRFIRYNNLYYYLYTECNVEQEGAARIRISRPREAVFFNYRHHRHSNIGRN
jgi:hypothetical protein